MSKYNFSSEWPVEPAAAPYVTEEWFRDNVHDFRVMNVRPQLAGPDIVQVLSVNGYRYTVIDSSGEIAARAINL